MADRDGSNRNREEGLASPSNPYDKEEGAKLWGVALFGLIGIGATATIYSGQLGRLLRRVDRFCGFSQQINKAQSSMKGAARRSSRKPFEEEAWRKYEEEMKKVFGRLLQQSSDFWVRNISQQINRTQSPWTWPRSWTWSWKWESSFGKASHEEAWRKHMRRMREEYEDEMERVERIRRMQSVFHRDRNKSKKSYESWTESGPGTYHQHSQRNDWYWKAGTSYRDQQTNRRETPQTPQSNPNYKLSHHYAVLGLNRSPAEPYTEAEIKSAFRAKAMQFHPDQNQDDKEAAEAKFKEVLIAYETIKSERKRK